MELEIEDTLAACANGVSMGKGVSFESRAAEMQGLETNDPGDHAYHKGKGIHTMYDVMKEWEQVETVIKRLDMRRVSTYQITRVCVFLSSMREGI